jgi:hypothetical protein
MSEALGRPEMNDLEASLARLAPSPAALDRDRLMFQAGRASVRVRWLWPACTGAAVLTAASLALVLALRPAPISVVEQRVVIVRQETPPPVPPHSDPLPEPRRETLVWSDEPLPQTEYLRRRQEVLRWGVDMLPPPPPGEPSSSPTLTPGSIREHPDQPF